jgi:hypothetical protein
MPAAKLKLASRIIAAAAKGERDPIQLRIAAFLEIVDGQGEDDLERSYLQLQRLREKVEQAEAAARSATASRAPYNPAHGVAG